MTENWLYFITSDYLASAENSANDIAPGPRIFKTPMDFPVRLNNADGPYRSIRNLKRNSIIFKDLCKRNGKRVQQILKPENIIEFTNDVLWHPRNNGIPGEMLQMITHCTNGHIVKGKVQGVHFYNKQKVKIVELISEDFMGVWEARIQFFNKDENCWLTKEKPSTFFPKDWTLQRLFEECIYAMDNSEKNLVEGFESKYLSRTRSGIPVNLVYSKDKLKTIYPILSKKS